MQIKVCIWHIRNNSGILVRMKAVKNPLTVYGVNISLLIMSDGVIINTKTLCTFCWNSRKEVKSLHVVYRGWQRSLVNESCVSAYSTCLFNTMLLTEPTDHPLILHMSVCVYQRGWTGCHAELWGWLWAASSHALWHNDTITQWTIPNDFSKVQLQELRSVGKVAFLSSPCLASRCCTYSSCWSHWSHPGTEAAYFTLYFRPICFCSPFSFFLSALAVFHMVFTSYRIAWDRKKWNCK